MACSTITRAEGLPPPSGGCEPLLEIPDCTPKQDCETRRDPRECNQCLLRNPFGGCAIRANDPICEAAKAAQDRAYELSKVACETGKAEQKEQCEAAKAAVMALNTERAACKSRIQAPSTPSGPTR